MALERFTTAKGMLVLLAILAILAAACSSAQPEQEIMRSPIVPFGELFATHDTVRLDPSVLIGSIGYLDVNARGELLISDEIGRGIHRFSPSGRHLNSYTTLDCLPDEANFIPGSSRFIGDSEVVTFAFGRAAAFFDAEGNCASATRRLDAFSKAICARHDSLYLHRVYVRDEATIGVYSPSLEALGKLQIDSPRFVLLNQFFQGQPGRSLECFEDGPYYIYAESMDGEAAWSSGPRFQPDFFEERPEDLPKGASAQVLSTMSDEYPSAVAIFALDGLTRMTVFGNLDERWRLDGTQSRIMVGLNIASNAGHFTGRSTISSVYPRAAADGFFYVLGPHEALADGELGNPVIVRYRFIRPESADG